MLGAYAFDMIGARIFLEENTVKTSVYPFLLCFSGLFIGLVFWHLLEVYWWGKDACDEENMKYHSVI